MIFEAKNLEEAYTKASEYFNKSISELEIKVIQQPSKGLLGFFSKNAIIEITPPPSFLENEKKDMKIENSEIVEEKVKNINDNEEEIQKKQIEDELKDNENVLPIEKVVELAQKEIVELFDLSCFEIDKIDVKIYDNETILFEINGKDAALLIGKEGYRYNALASMLFSWISQKYGFKTRLEIASFLESQEEMMRKFLEPTIREIEEKGRCKTKPFDGVLVYIALEILRTEFPHKYVAIKQNKSGENYIIVNDFLRKND